MLWVTKTKYGMITHKRVPGTTPNGEVLPEELDNVSLPEEKRFLILGVLKCLARLQDQSSPAPQITAWVLL